MAVKGRDLVSGIPRTILIDDTEVRAALEDCVTTIIGAIRQALEHTPPELSGDIIDRGIVLTGGGSYYMVWMTGYAKKHPYPSSLSTIH